MSNFKTTPSQITDRPPFNVAKKMHEAYFGPPDEVQPATPEQMREAANNDEDLIRRIDAITVAHQYTTSLDDPRMFAEMRAIPIAPQPVAVTVLPIELAPRDSTMLWLLVDYSGDGHNPLEAAIQAWTIGFNSLTYTDVDKWEFAGWSWEQDCFTQGYGEVIGWRHLDVHIDPSATPASAHVDDLATTAPQPADPLSDPRVVALVEAATKIASLQKITLTDIGSAHSNRGAGASGWMREDDRDFMRDLHNAFTSVTAALRAIGGEA